MSGLAVSCEGLLFRRGPRVVLDVPALTFPAGRTTALLGPNGSGKSTLLRLVAGLERPTAGRILLDGHEARDDRRTHELVAFAFQQAVFVTGTVQANISLGLRLRKVSKREAAQRAALAAELCGIGHLLGRDAARLSGGEAQRANLARALALHAPITLLDEPLAGLDAPARESLLQDLPGILAALGGTAVVVTHDREEALRLGDEMAVLLEGRVHAAGPLAAVFGDPPDVATAKFLGYTLVPDGEGVLAIAPGALRPGAGEVTLELTVAEVRDLGTAVEVTGTVRGMRLSLQAEPGTAAGAMMLVSAPARATKAFPRPA